MEQLSRSPQDRRALKKDDETQEPAPRKSNKKHTNWLVADRAEKLSPQLISLVVRFIVFLQIHKQNIHMDFSIVSRTNLDNAQEKNRKRSPHPTAKIKQINRNTHTATF